MAKNSIDSTGIIQPIEGRYPKMIALRAVFYIIFILLACVFLLPLLWMIISSFKTTQEFIQIPPTLFPEHWDFGKLARVWEKTKLGKAYWNTVVMMVGELAFLLVSNGLAGYVLSRLKPTGTKLVLALTLLSMMMPNNLTMVPLFITFTKVPILGVSLLNTYFPMWLMAGVRCFTVMMYKSFFDGIPISYIESARLDGCTDLGIFFRIMLPLSKPIIVTSLIFGMTDGWGAFLWPYLVLSDQNLITVGVKAYSLGTQGMDESLMGLMFIAIPPILFFVFFQKYIMHGMSAGGVKG